MGFHVCRQSGRIWKMPSRNQSSLHRFVFSKEQGLMDGKKIARPGRVPV